MPGAKDEEEGRCRAIEVRERRLLQKQLAEAMREIAALRKRLHEIGLNLSEKKTMN